MRDLKMIFYKLKYVLLPRMREEKGKELRKCLIIPFFFEKIFCRGFMGTIIIVFATGSVN